MIFRDIQGSTKKIFVLGSMYYTERIFEENSL